VDLVTRLFLIRHAETDLAGTVCGQIDPPLNAAGLQQIQHLLNLLRNEPLEAVFASDLRRAVDTAHPIAEAFNVACFIRAGLREINFGRWEGLRWSEIEAFDPISSAGWLAAFPHLPAPGGERFKDFEARILAEANDILGQTQFQSVAIVTHAGAMRTILRRISGVDDERAWHLTKPYCAALCLTEAGCEVLS
jgi:broad specificity phosphatase PhoE